jgi:hypothetical protein
MIHVHGDSQTREYEAAQALKKAVLDAWPHVETAADQHIYLIAGAQCHGQLPRDIDLLLLADLGEGERINPFLAFCTNPEEPLQRIDEVTVRNLCCAIEVKDHTPERVRFEGTAVKVQYKDGYHVATTQNEKQKFSVKHYLEGQGLSAPFVTSLLWLRNVPNTQLPPRPHTIIGAQPTWPLLLNVIGQSARSWKNKQGYSLSSFGPQSSTVEEAARAFIWTMDATKLDRQRIERLNQQAADEAGELPIGQKLIVLRGRGGSGKTVRLLHLAKSLYDKEDARVLLLTYNKALVADVRRLLTLMGIPDDIAAHSIQVQTAHEFFYSVLSHPSLGLAPSQEEFREMFLPQFDQLKAEALALFKSGAATRDDIDAAKTWDYVFVDEGQDWPHNERDLLAALVGPERLVVADGVDQYVRTQTPAKWRDAVTKSQFHRTELKTCLRMKANLARFANAFNQAIGLVSDRVVPHEEAVGGRVIVLDGSYFANDALHRRLIEMNGGDGNAPIDMLFCVPPSLVTRTPKANSDDKEQMQSLPGQVFTQWGYKVWDGVDLETRSTYPTSIEQLRIVQYDSCRGLEGWVTVNLALDDFYEHKKALFEKEPAQDSAADAATQAHLKAARWAMIPLTRAMDTLVITLHQPHGRLRMALESAAKECGDFLEWQTLR